MKNQVLCFFATFAFCINFSQAQYIVANPKDYSVTSKKIAGAEILIPIKIDFINTDNNPQSPTINITIVNSAPDLINQFSSTDFRLLSVINNNQTIRINPGATVEAPAFNIRVPQAIPILCEKIINIEVRENLILLCTITVTILPSEQVYSLTQYVTAGAVRLDNIIKVESTNNILTISGYKSITDNGMTRDLFLKRSVSLQRQEVYSVTEKSWVFNSIHWLRAPFSLITVPFKVRPKKTSNGTVLNNSVTAGITNLGFNLDLAKVQMERYFSTGKKSTHKLSLGFWGAPSVEELDNTYTNGFLPTGAKSKQLFISTGITISYTYNDLTFILVPAGWDLSTSTIGSNWSYDGTRWWGFGIGISPKTFTTILNK